MTLTTEMQAVAKELLTEFGVPMTLVQTSSSSYNSATLTATEGSGVVSILGVFFDPSNSNLTGYETTLPDDVKMGGKWLYVYSDTEVKTGDTVAFGAKEFKIHSATALSPQGIAILYRIATQEVA